MRGAFRGERTDQLFAADPALGDDGAIDQHHRNAEVVKPVQLVVGVDIGKLGLGVQLLEQAQGVLAKVAPLPGNEYKLHSGQGIIRSREPADPNRSQGAIRRSPEYDPARYRESFSTSSKSTSPASSASLAFSGSAT